jgi:hypothetical protein
MFYELSVFQELVRAESWGYLNEARPRRTKEKLQWSDDEVAALLCGLVAGDFQRSVPDCEVHDCGELEYVTADQYRIFWDETSHSRSPRWTRDTLELSLKIAIVEDDEGKVAGVVTLHLSGSPM